VCRIHSSHRPDPRSPYQKCTRIDNCIHRSNRPCYLICRCSRRRKHLSDTARREAQKQTKLSEGAIMLCRLLLFLLLLLLLLLSSSLLLLLTTYCAVLLGHLNASTAVMLQQQQSARTTAETRKSGRMEEEKEGVTAMTSKADGLVDATSVRLQMCGFVRWGLQIPECLAAGMFYFFLFSLLFLCSPSLYSSSVLSALSLCHRVAPLPSFLLSFLTFVSSQSTE
jgi:hypothetical protein